MLFNGRQEPKEFVSSMPEYDEDQDEYYGEEDGEADDGDEYYEDDDEDDDEEEDSDSGKPSEGKNWVKTALMGLAAFALLGGVAYYALLTLAPEVVDEVVNSVTASEPAPEEAPPAQTAAAPPAGEAAPPPPGAVAPEPPSAPTATPRANETVAPPSSAAGKTKRPKFAIPTPAPEAEVLEPVEAPEPKPVVRKPPVKPKPKPRYPVTHVKKKPVWVGQRVPRASQHRGGAHRRSYSTAVNAPGTQWIQGHAYIPWSGTKTKSSGWQHAPKAGGAARVRSLPRGRYGVQVGSFSDARNASALVTQLRSQGIQAYVGRSSGGMTRVYVGSYPSLRSAGSVMRKLQRQGIPAAVTSN
ncbi:MAG: SPOR domain-containing protein [Candidatus Sericytochromatia bacterium]|nr:SPOR domain-containing protein [Candidatus Sericytochromatia bacterium]